MPEGLGSFSNDSGSWSSMCVGDDGCVGGLECESDDGKEGGGVVAGIWISVAHQGLPCTVHNTHSPSMSSSKLLLLSLQGRLLFSRGPKK